MSNRAFKFYTIAAGGSPQPVIGTHLTAAVLANQIAPQNYRAGVKETITLQVADSSMFLPGDYVDIVDPATGVTERTSVYVVPDATHLTVTALKLAHPGGAAGTGAWVSLGAFAQSLYIQSVAGNTGPLYIGATHAMVKATGVGVISVLQEVEAGIQPIEFSTSRQGLANAETLSQYWIDGTTGDSYLPSIGVV